MDKIKNMTGFFEVKEVKESDYDFIIAGVANRYEIDRANEIMDPLGFKLDNYAKNPIVLYQHDHTQPAGKCIDMRPVDKEGLYVKVYISKAVPNIRTLVKEGVLNSFSVGFKSVLEEYDQEKGCTVIKEAELHEISIVSVPCQQSSQFVQIKSENALSKKEMPQEELDRIKEELSKVTKFLEITSQVKQDESTTIQTLILSKERFNSEEAARAWVEENGFRSDKVDETDDSYRYRQMDPDEFMEGSFRTIELTDGVQAVIGRMKGEEGKIYIEGETSPNPDAIEAPRPDQVQPSYETESPQADNMLLQLNKLNDEMCILTGLMMKLVELLSGNSSGASQPIQVFIGKGKSQRTEHELLIQKLEDRIKNLRSLIN